MQSVSVKGLLKVPQILFQTLYVIRLQVSSAKLILDAFQMPLSMYNISLLYFHSFRKRILYLNQTKTQNLYQPLIQA